jgi:hypothetical protein
LTLASFSTPLYRVLEGYLFWPERLQTKRINSHRKARAEAKALVGRRRGSEPALNVQASLALERFHRYPDHASQVAPTRLGNAIRRFEYYSYDRYQLSSQLMWSQLRGAVDEAVSKEVNNARAGVDFFVCLFYVSGLVAVCALLGLLSDGRDVSSLVLAAAIGLVATVACYRAAVVATDAWASAVKGMVDLARLPLADALGLRVPDTLEEERQMWLKVGWFVGYGFSNAASTDLDRYRRTIDKDDRDSGIAG